MKIVVCCKAVPGVVTEAQVAPDGQSVDYCGEFLTLNDCDESALEEALVLKRAHGAEVTVLTMGPITALAVLYQALAKGADRAVRIDAQSQDPQCTGAALAAAIKQLGFDLVLAGAQSRDTLAGQTGIVVAQRLSIPFAYAVVEVELTRVGTLTVRKELGGGRHARLELSLPALLCVQTGIQPVTYVPPARMMRARQQPVRSFSPTELGLDAEQLVPHGYRFVDVYQPQRSSRVEFLQGGLSEIAAALVGKIKEAL